jgi:hypothetical protein
MRLVILCLLIVLCLAQLTVAAPDPTFFFGGREGGGWGGYGGYGGYGGWGGYRRGWGGREGGGWYGRR